MQTDKLMQVVFPKQASCCKQLGFNVSCWLMFVRHDILQTQITVPFSYMSCYAFSFIHLKSEELNSDQLGVVSLGNVHDLIMPLLFRQAMCYIAQQSFTDMPYGMYFQLCC